MKPLPFKKVPLVNLMIEHGFARSKPIARRLIVQQGIIVNGELVFNMSFEAEPKSILKIRD